MLARQSLHRYIFWHKRISHQPYSQLAQTLFIFPPNIYIYISYYKIVQLHSVGMDKHSGTKEFPT